MNTKIVGATKNNNINSTAEAASYSKTTRHSATSCVTACEARTAHHPHDL